MLTFQLLVCVCVFCRQVRSACELWNQQTQKKSQKKSKKKKKVGGEAIAKVRRGGK